MDAVWVNELYIGTAYTPGTGGAAGTWTYSKLCKGIEGRPSMRTNRTNRRFSSAVRASLIMRLLGRLRN